LIFEWNIAKSEKNLKNHGISFTEAEQAFEDFYAIEEFDEEHSTNKEQRFKMLAVTGEKILVVIYTMRDENYRIISARSAEKSERELYEKQRSENAIE
jgi:uncharacterized protein